MVSTQPSFWRIAYAATELLLLRRQHGIIPHHIAELLKVLIIGNVLQGRKLSDLTAVEIQFDVTPRANLTDLQHLLLFTSVSG